MIPWDTFKTPQDAYTWAQENARELKFVSTRSGLGCAPSINWHVGYITDLGFCRVWVPIECILPVRR